MEPDGETRRVLSVEKRGGERGGEWRGGEEEIWCLWVNVEGSFGAMGGEGRSS